MTKKRTKKQEAPEALTGAPASMKPEIHTFGIDGTSPLLQNNPANFIGVEEGDTLGPKKKEYDDAEEARLRVYLTEDGHYYHPAEAFSKAIVRAVTGKKFGKQTATTIIKGAVFLAEPYALLENEKGRPLAKYDIDRRSVVINKKARVLRCRPVWPKWRIRLALEIDVALISPEQVKQALSLAGRIIGIGDYRPEKGGGFGRFTVKLLG